MQQERGVGAGVTSLYSGEDAAWDNIHCMGEDAAWDKRYVMGIGEAKVLDEHRRAAGRAQVRLDVCQVDEDIIESEEVSRKAEPKPKPYPT